LLHAFGLGDRDAGLGYVNARAISCRGRTRADSDDYGNQNNGNDDSHTDSSDVSHANARPRAANSAVDSKEVYDDLEETLDFFSRDSRRRLANSSVRAMNKPRRDADGGDRLRSGDRRFQFTEQAVPVSEMEREHFFKPRQKRQRFSRVMTVGL